MHHKICHSHHIFIFLSFSFLSFSSSFPLSLNPSLYHNFFPSLSTSLIHSIWSHFSNVLISSQFFFSAAVLIPLPQHTSILFHMPQFVYWKQPERIWHKNRRACDGELRSRKKNWWERNSCWIRADLVVVLHGGKLWAIQLWRKAIRERRTTTWNWNQVQRWIVLMVQLLITMMSVIWKMRWVLNWVLIHVHVFKFMCSLVPTKSLYRILAWRRVTKILI